MTDVDLAYLNYRNGGLMKPGGGYDFEPLRQAVSPLRDRPPLVMAFCEGKRWLANGSTGMNLACAMLDDTLGRPYVGLPGWHWRGDYGPAIAWDAQVLRLISWTGVEHETNAAHGRNVARFAVRGKPGQQFKVMIRHYSFDSGTERMAEAERDAPFAGDDDPTALVGDLNSSASGDHLPQRDWSKVPMAKRRHKAMLVNGRWVADTRALDILIGEQVAVPAEQSFILNRSNGAGFAALAELACAAGMPREQAFVPTTNRGVDSGGGLIIDWMLANPALANLFVPDSYAVHMPDGEYPSTWPLDHRLITARFSL